MRLRTPIGVGVTTTAVFLGTLGLALAAPASAGVATTRVATAAPTAPDALPGTLPAPGVGTPAAFTASGAGPANVITCTVNVQNPHNSSHVHGTVSTISTISCTGAMSELAQYVGLYYNNVLVGQLPFSNNGVASLRGIFATPCKNGTYVGASSWLEVPPAGYYPPYSKGLAYSNVVKIVC
jgi:hypothetical protein